MKRHIRFLSAGLAALILVAGCTSCKKNGTASSDGIKLSSGWTYTDVESMSDADKTVKLSDSESDSQSKVGTLKTNYLSNPVGLDETPTFSWVFSSAARAKRQVAYQVMVSSSAENLQNGTYDMWNSGQVRSNSTFGIKYEGSALRASTSYYWTVKIWNEKGQFIAASEAASFTTGILDEGWNNAQWIGPDYAGSDDGIAPLLRKDFSVSKTVQKAYAYATAAGSYEMYINGQRCGDTYLNPGCFSYNDYLIYQTYDVTSLLKNGSNAVGVILGNGYFDFKGAGHDYGTQKAFYGKIKIMYTDGSIDTIITDTSWKTSLDGPIRKNDLYKGETYDANKEMPGWDNVGFNASGWQDALIIDTTKIINGYDLGSTIYSECANVSPIKCIDTFNAVSVTQPKPGVFVYDMGKNFAGTMSITASGGKGTQMTVKVGEILADDGTASQKIYEGRDLIYTYIFNGGKKTFEPTLTYNGFRYIEISGVGELPLSSVKGLQLSSVSEETSEYECSNELLNKYYAAEMLSLKSNFMSQITDCPTREKNGWTGDAQVTSKTAAYMIDGYYSFYNYMRMIRCAQSSAGCVPDIVPVRGEISGSDCASAWGDSVVIIPWELYNQYGDKSIIEDNYEAMCKWVNYLDASCAEGGYVRLEGDKYRDHLNYEQNTVYKFISTAYSAYSADLLSRMATILGKNDDAAKYNKIYNAFRLAWQKIAIQSDGATIKPASQTGYVLGLYFGLFDSDKRDAAAQNLKKLMEKDGHQTCGYTGIGLLYDTLSDNGLTDTAFKFYQNTDIPSLVGQIAKGAGNIWETYVGGSHNHHVYGAPVQWMISKVAGIDNAEIGGGYKQFVLAPNFGDLTYAKAKYNSRRGVITSDWKLDGTSGYEYNCTVPSNTTAKVYLPLGTTGKAKITESDKDVSKAEGLTYVCDENGCAVYTIESGSYNFTVVYE